MSLAALSGCTDSNPVAGDADPIPTNVASPAALIESYAESIRRMDYEVYRALLEKPDESTPGFRFVVRSDDVDELPSSLGS